MSSWQTKPGNNERGWNDPPMFIYGSGGSSNLNTSRRNILSKRVAFPLNNTPNYAPMDLHTQNNFYNPTQYANPQGYYNCTEPATLLLGAPAPAQNVQLLPPSTYSQPPSYHGPVVVPTMPIIGAAPPMNSYQGANFQSPLVPVQPGIATDPMSELPVAAVMDDSDLQVPNFADDEQMYHYCVTRLQRALNECRATTEERLLSEMQKKLSIFSDMWKSGKISYIVKSSMARLATAIHRRKYLAANEIHLVLMMDHVSEVSRWLVGIKKLVQEVEKAPQHPTSPSVSCSYDNNVETSQDVNPNDTQILESLSNVEPFHVCSSYRPTDKNSNVVQQLSEDFGGFGFNQWISSTTNGIDYQNPVVDQYSPRLSHSPPTFDAEMIAQCFNGHGELKMNFVNDEHGTSRSVDSNLNGSAYEDSQLIIIKNEDLTNSEFISQNCTSKDETFDRPASPNEMDQPDIWSKMDRLDSLNKTDQPPSSCDAAFDADQIIPSVQGGHVETDVGINSPTDGGGDRS